MWGWDEMIIIKCICEISALLIRTSKGAESLYSITPKADFILE
jgi:hypothetical protein